METFLEIFQKTFKIFQRLEIYSENWNKNVKRAKENLHVPKE
jgi:hypothetical protein